MVLWVWERVHSPRHLTMRNLAIFPRGIFLNINLWVSLSCHTSPAALETQFIPLLFRTYDSDTSTFCTAGAKTILLSSRLILFKEGNYETVRHCLKWFDLIWPNPIWSIHIWSQEFRNSQFGRPFYLVDHSIWSTPIWSTILFGRHLFGRPFYLVDTYLVDWVIW